MTKIICVVENMVSMMFVGGLITGICIGTIVTLYGGRSKNGGKEEQHTDTETNEQ